MARADATGRECDDSRRPDSAADDVRFRESAPGSAAVPQPTLEIRMLGPFQVGARTAAIVDRGEWRTGKVSDLLRLLALRGGDPVPRPDLVAALWPGSDQRHGNASLRTAASQVRRVVGAEFLERSLAGIRLRDVWVDVTEFRDLSGQGPSTDRSGRDRCRGTGLPGEADRLVPGRFHRP